MSMKKYMILGIVFLLSSYAIQTSHHRLTIDTALANNPYTKAFKRDYDSIMLAKTIKNIKNRPFFYISSDDDSDAEPDIKKICLEEKKPAKRIEPCSDSDDSFDDEILTIPVSPRRETNPHTCVPRLNLTSCKKYD